MPRTQYVMKARKPQGKCEVCGKAINRGDPYQYVEPRYGPKRVRHTTCRAWRPSELTSSKMGTVWGAQEAFADESFTTREELAQGITSVAEAARQVGEEYEESAQNIEDGFGHEVPMSEELRERAQELEGWADELEGAASDAESGDDECATCGLAEDDDSDVTTHLHEFDGLADQPEQCAASGCEVPEDGHHEFEVDLTDAISEAESVVDSCPV